MLRVHKTLVTMLFLSFAYAWGYQQPVWPLGDSNTKGWKDGDGILRSYRYHLLDAFDSYGLDTRLVGTQVDENSVRHDGMVGITAEQMYYSAYDRIESLLYDEGEIPSIVLLECGTNDLVNGSDAMATSSYVLYACDQINQWYDDNYVNRPIIIVGNVPPFRAASGGSSDPMVICNLSAEDIRTDYYGYYNYYGIQPDNVFFVDLYGWALGYDIQSEADVWTTSSCLPNYHYNDFGYSEMAWYGFMDFFSANSSIDYDDWFYSGYSWGEFDKSYYNSRTGAGYSWTWPETQVSECTDVVVMLSPANGLHFSMSQDQTIDVQWESTGSGFVISWSSNGGRTYTTIAGVGEVSEYIWDISDLNYTGDAIIKVAIYGQPSTADTRSVVIEQ